MEVARSVGIVVQRLHEGICRLNRVTENPQSQRRGELDVAAGVMHGLLPKCPNCSEGYTAEVSRAWRMSDSAAQGGSVPQAGVDGDRGVWPAGTAGWVGRHSDHSLSVESPFGSETAYTSEGQLFVALDSLQWPVKWSLVQTIRVVSLENEGASASQ